MSQRPSNVHVRPKETSTTSSTLLAGRDVKEFSVAPPMIDVRGWSVQLATGVTVGTVERFLLHAGDLMPRYLGVQMHDSEGLRLIPIGIPTIDHASRSVVLELEHETVQALPVVTKSEITHEVEREVFSVVTGVRVQSLAFPESYHDPMYDASELYGAKIRRADIISTPSGTAAA